MSNAAFSLVYQTALSWIANAEAAAARAKALAEPPARDADGECR